MSKCQNVECGVWNVECGECEECDMMVFHCDHSSNDELNVKMKPYFNWVDVEAEECLCRLAVIAFGHFLCGCEEIEQQQE